MTLDSLLDHFPRPDVLKIDVEEAEARVLAGAGTVLRGSPVVVCEVAESNAARVGEILRFHGYRFYDARSRSDARREVESPPAELLAVREESES